MERSVGVTSETVRQWGVRFGQTYAHQRRSRRARPGDTGLRDEGFLTSNGKTPSRWRAVDQDGTVLAMRVQSRRTWTTP